MLNPLRFHPLAAWLPVSMLAAGLSLLPSQGHAEVVADSAAEFSGIQGENGWTYGYRNKTVDQGADYNPATTATEGLDYDPDAAFIAFPGGSDQGDYDPTTQLWNNGFWDLNPAASAPWTEIRSQLLHPNGGNNFGEHWCIRRWQPAEFSGVTPIAITYSVRKDNTGGGNGVTAGIWLNGARQDSVTIRGNDGTGVSRTLYLNVNPADRIDLVLSPVGTDGNPADGADGSANSMVVNTTIPDWPIQPNGRLFIPANATDSDGDTIPDFYENHFFPGDLTKLNETSDVDGDGVKDLTELVTGTDPTKTDTDGDGLSDKVETGTGTFVDANDTGTNPLVADTDGDGLSDGAEITGDLPSNPTLVDTDTDTYSDGDEVRSGHNPNDPSDTLVSNLLADSIAQFSGVQGQDNWYYGYHEAIGAPNATTYDPATDFTQFADDVWRGNIWDLNTAASAPWTELSAQGTHPNGQPNSIHWTIRRWVAGNITQATPVALRYHSRKTNLGGGNGITGGIAIDGKIVDSAAVAFNDGVGFVRTYYVNLQPGTIIDLILSPKGTDGGQADGSDGSANYLHIDATIPAVARQPDGSLFVPATAGDTDGDGLPDLWEKAYFPNDLTQLSGTGDYDKDGLNDGGEYTRNTDPTKPDSDNDGLSDNVESNTNVFVNAGDTGSNPNKADTDGDGIADGAEVNGNPATNPTRADSDSDSFSDSEELAEGTNPNDSADNPFSMVIANSKGEFSGVQGQDNWFNGYRNFTDDGGEVNYDPTIGFIPYPGGEGEGDWAAEVQLWNNGSWDMNTAAAGPWTFQANEAAHPNGTVSAPNKEHWSIRRWVNNELAQETPAAIIWSLRKENAGCGDGVTGAIYVNGTLLDTAAIAYNDSIGIKRKYYVNLKPGDIIDYALLPKGTDAAAVTDYCDGSWTSFVVDLRIPANPVQPDGTPFVPSSGLRLEEPSYDLPGKQVVLTWTSKVGTNYAIEESSDLVSWVKIAGAIAGQLNTTSQSIPLTTPAAAQKFFRVITE